ncbi:cupin domain-containing protein [Nocardioides sp. GY 10113]|uniref:cupin domain-containing protein n=1 Tax=Nocardioides sp. GY 10113 TaxID=2569761 RepID=UPI0010A917FB|nr:cupin domain-containing protein [Nocardioides sp. GY 10113]TIC87358.1 cupin domain-containing protein [Nocardioides sp. GY 10113]
MHIATQDLPITMNALGAVARHQGDFGVADGALAAEHLSLAAGVDIAPLLTGLEHDLCGAPHWGYLSTGRVVVTYADGRTETCAAGEMFHWPAGHTVRVEEDAEILMFSPAAEHRRVMNHMLGMLAVSPA